MNNKLHGYVRYPDKWIAATFALSDAAYRAYDMILSWMWLNAEDQCSIPDDAATLAMATGMSGPKLKRAMAEIQNEHAPLLKKEDGRLVSNGLRKEADRSNAMRAQRREAIRKRWAKRDTGVLRDGVRNDTGVLRDSIRPVSSSYDGRNRHKTETETEDKTKDLRSINADTDRGDPRGDLARPRRRGGPPQSVGSVGLGAVTPLSVDGLVSRIETVAREPAWTPWWRDTLQALADAGGDLGRVDEHVRYAEDCGNAQVRRAKDLGELAEPGRWLSKQVMDLCRQAGVRWGRFPAAARTAP